MAATKGLGEFSNLANKSCPLREIGWKSPTLSALKDCISAPAIKSFLAEINTAALMASSAIISSMICSKTSINVGETTFTCESF